MTWQDVMIGVGLLLLTYSVVPLIRKQFRLKQGFTPYDTSLLIAGVEASFIIPFWTTQYWVSVISCAVLTALWSIVALQRRMYKENRIWGKY